MRRVEKRQTNFKFGSTIEKLNIALSGDPELQNKIYSAEKVLLDKYCDGTLTTYVGENPISIVEADLLTRSIIIRVDPNKVASDGDNLSTETTIDGIPIRIEYSQVVRLDGQVIQCRMICLGNR